MKYININPHLTTPQGIINNLQRQYCMTWSVMTTEIKYDKEDYINMNYIIINTIRFTLLWNLNGILMVRKIIP